MESASKGLRGGKKGISQEQGRTKRESAAVDARRQKRLDESKKKRGSRPPTSDKSKEKFEDEVLEILERMLEGGLPEGSEFDMDSHWEKDSLVVAVSVEAGGYDKVAVDIVEYWEPKETTRQNAVRMARQLEVLMVDIYEEPVTSDEEESE